MKKLLYLSIFLNASVNASDCFTMYDEHNRMTFRANVSPINLAKTIAEEMEKKYPKMHLVWSRGVNDCEAYFFKNNENHAIDGEQLLKSESSLFKSESITKSNVDSIGLPTSTQAGRSPGKDIRVDAHTKKDGTHVASYTRAQPQRKK